MDALKNVIIITLLCSLLSPIDSQLAAFRKLQKVDNEMSSFCQSLLDAIIHQDVGIGKTHKAALKNIAIAGSTKEGAMVTRVFKPSKTGDGVNKEIETDLEYNLMEIPISHKDHIEDIPGKEGFIKVRMTNDMLGFASKVGWKVDPKEYDDYLSAVSENGYLKPYYFKEKVLEKVTVQNHDGVIELILAIALDVDLDRVSLSHPLQEVTKSSVGSYIDILLDNELQVKVSWDVVTVIKLSWWPEVATEWVERKRNWPSKDTISELSRFVYIITKPSDDDKSVKDTLELRYSFAHIERELISQRSPQQTFVYLVFKSMLYKWIKPIDSEQIHSFIAKTAMFWTCERYPPDHTFWDETSTIPALKFLFSELLKSIEAMYLPYYFIPKTNVIGKIKGDLRRKMIHQINEMLIDIENYIPNNVNEVIAVCKEMTNIIKASYKVMNDLRQNNYKTFLKRPDLLPKALEVYGSHMMELANDKKDEIDDIYNVVKDNVKDKIEELGGLPNDKTDGLDDIYNAVKDSVKDKLKELGSGTLNLKDVSKKVEDVGKKVKKFLEKYEL